MKNKVTIFIVLTITSLALVFNYAKGSGGMEYLNYLTSVLSDSDWTIHDSYPSACGSGQYVSAIGDTLTCATPAGGGGGGGSGAFSWDSSKNLNYPATTTAYFLIGAAATSTPAQLEIVGKTVATVFQGGQFIGTSTATSTLSSGLEAGTKIGAPYFIATSTTATSSFVNLKVTQGAISSLASCDTIDTDANGYLKCGTDGGGSGSGSGSVSTSTSPTIGNLAYWTSKDAWPETLGTVATTTLTENSLALSLSQPISVIGGLASVLSLATSSLFSYPWTVANGGTGSTTLSGILKGNGTGVVATAVNGTDYTLTTAQSCTNQVITALTAIGGSTCSSVSNAMLSNSTISGVALGSNLAALTNDATLSGSSYNGSSAISDWGINLANPNSWTGLQQFANATSTLLSATYASSTTICLGGSCRTTWPSGVSPLSNKGDIYVFGAADDRLPVGTDGKLLMASSSAALGVDWMATSTLGITGGAGSQTPWTSNIDAASYSLENMSFFTASSTSATSTVAGPLGVGGYMYLGPYLYDGAYPQYTGAFLPDNYIADFTKDIDSWVTTNFNNPNAGASSTVDISFNNNLTTDTDGDGNYNYYADIGYTGSNFSYYFYGLQNTPNMSYWYNTDGPISITTATSSSVGYIQFVTGGFGGAVAGAEAARITSTGAFGIGSTSPTARLTVTNPLSTKSLVVEDQANDPSPFVIDASGMVGIGTSTPYAKLSVVGLGVFDNINATSSTATSTFSGNLNTVGDLTAGSAYLGALTFSTDAGLVNAMDLPLSATNALAGINEGFSFTLGGVATSSITMLGQHTGPNGSIRDFTFGIATATPAAKLSIEGQHNETMPLLLISTSSASYATNTAVLIDNNGNMGIATGTAAGISLAVGGSMSAKAYYTYSPMYNGDALTALKGIKAEAGQTGEWAEVDHYSLPEGVLKESVKSHYESYYDKLVTPATYSEAVINQDTLEEITPAVELTPEKIEYKKISNGDILTKENYDKLSEAEKGKTIVDSVVPLMSISGLTQMNTRAIQQLDEKINLLGTPIGSVNQNGGIDFDSLKQQIKDELKPDIQLIVDEAIDNKIKGMGFMDKIKLLFK